MPARDGEQSTTSELSHDEVSHQTNKKGSQLVVRSKINLEHAKILYGRDHEINTLVSAYQRSLIQQRGGNGRNDDDNDTKSTVVNDTRTRQELVLISGSSGTGKTALASNVSSVVQNDGGFYLSGKFELSGSQDPYAVFVAAFTRLVFLLVGDSDNNNNDDATTKPDDQRLPKIRTAIQEAVGNDGKVLTDMIPALEKLIGPQDETCTMTGNEALHRFHFVFTKFCRAVSSVAPLVLFLDDLQWSDQASLELLQTLLQPTLEHAASSFLVIASYRSDEVDLDDGGSHDDATTCSKTSFPKNNKAPFSNHLKRWWLDEPPDWLRVTHIQLSNLDESALNELVADSLRLCGHSIRPLTELIHNQSGGNAFHALRYLRMLADQGVLYRDQTSEKIRWDDFNAADPQILMMERSADDVIREKLNELPPSLQEVLQLAACLGDEFEASKVAMLTDNLDVEAVMSVLALAVSEDFLDLMQDQGLYRFHHDRVRQAILSTITNEDEFSFQIGKNLWQRLSPISLSASIYMVVNLLNKGGNDRIHGKEERYKAAELNFEAGRKAASLAAFPDASRYLAQGMMFLKGEDYWKEKYKLALNLFNSAADVEVCLQNFDRAIELTDEVFANARNDKDKLHCYVTRINAIGQNGSVLEAMNFGLEALRRIGEPLASEPTIGVIVAEKLKTTFALLGRSNESLLSMTTMTNEDKIAAIHIMDIIIPYAFQAGSPYGVLLGMRIVQICMKYGLTKRCAVGFVTFAWFLCRDDRKRGYRIGQFALSLVSATRARELIPRVHLSFYFLTHHWSRPIRESLEPLRETTRIGMEIGDIEYASYSFYFQCTHALYSGVCLLQTEAMSLEAANAVRQYKQENVLQSINPTLYYAQHMIGRQDAPSYWDKNEESDNKMGMSYKFSFASEVAYMFGDYTKAEHFVNERLGLKVEQFAMYGHALNKFYHGLIAVALARQGHQPKKNVKVAKNMLKMLDLWARDCPENFLSKQRLLLAEVRSVTLKRLNSKTHNLYGQSFEFASKHGFTHEAALACERAGDYMHRHGEDGLASTYWVKAHSLYTEWGGTVKADHLQSHIEQRLKSSAKTKPAATSAIPIVEMSAKK